MNYYSSNPNKSDKFVAKKNSVFSTLTELYNVLDEMGWCEYSVFSKGQWNNENKCCGQCNATVLLVQEYFGGEIVQYENPTGKKSMHYFNRIGYVEFTSIEYAVDSTFGSLFGTTSYTASVSVDQNGTKYYIPSKIKKVTITKQDRIPAYAFANCYFIEEITLSDNASAIENNAFYGCSALKTMALPSSVTEVGSYAFYGCRNMMSITFDSYMSRVNLGDVNVMVLDRPNSLKPIMCFYAIIDNIPTNSADIKITREDYEELRNSLGEYATIIKDVPKFIELVKQTPSLLSYQSGYFESPCSCQPTVYPAMKVNLMSLPKHLSE